MQNNNHVGADLCVCLKPRVNTQVDPYGYNR